MATLQELKGLLEQALLRKILENKLYTLYDNNKHVYCQSYQKPIILYHSNDRARLKEYIITSMHIKKSQKSRSKRMYSTFLISFFDQIKDNYNMLVMDNDFIDLTESIDDNDKVLQINQNQKPLKIISKDSKKYDKVFYLIYLAIKIIV